MKVSLSWILDYLDGYDGSAQTVQKQLTFSGTEVDSAEPCGDDVILDLGVTSNRVDCLCHLGVAREVAAASGARLTPPPQVDALAFKGEATHQATSVEIRDPDDCPRFTAHVLEGVKVGPTPEPFKSRLESLGLRSINNIADITNYVMLELNQPLHAYDLEKIEEERLVVRRAEKGESLVAINGHTYELSPDDLVIADARQPVGLAGVMGGLDSEVSETTTRVLLESASFCGPLVRKTARRHQLHSDASHRFERGVSRAGAMDAARRAVDLILQHCGGWVRPDPLDAGGAGPAPEPIPLRLQAVERLCGISVDAGRAKSILERLECQVTQVAEDRLEAVPPPYRADLVREVDLIEEVMRIHGLNHIPDAMDMPVRPVPEHPARTLRESVRDRLVQLGCFETVTPDFVDDGSLGQVTVLDLSEPLKVMNPVRAGESTLRRSLLPSLLQVRKRNYDRGNQNLRLFEVSDTYGRNPMVPKGLSIRSLLGVLVDGDLRDARGILDDLLARYRVHADIVVQDAPSFESGSALYFQYDQQVLARSGYVDKALLKLMGLKVRPVYFELDVDALLRAGGLERQFEELPRFPGIERDLAVILKRDVSYAQLESLVDEVDLAHLDSLELFDVYEGKQVGKGRRSLAIRMVFRSLKRTLTAEEVDQGMSRLLVAIEERLGGEVRGG